MSSGGTKLETVDSTPFRSVAEILRWRAERSPNSTAFSWLGTGGSETGSLSYSDLHARACAVAAALAQGHFGAGPVLLAYPPGLELIAALFGCFYAGTAAVVTTPPGSASVERLRQLSIEAAATGLLTTASLAQTLGAQIGQDVVLLATDDLSADETQPAPVADAESLALIQFTSGSTASPRGVMLTHGNLIANLLAQAQATRIAEGETAVSWLPFHHDMGLFGFVLFPVFAGFKSVLMPPLAFLKHPLGWLRALSDHRGVLSAAPCFAYELCARRLTFERAAALDLSAWRVAVCGAEVVRAEILERFAEVLRPSGFSPRALAPAYGLAEATLLATSVEAGEGLVSETVDAVLLGRGFVGPPDSAERARRLVSCGRPWPGHEMAIMDPDKRVGAGPGEVGEIWFRGPSVSPGYWRQAETSAAVFGIVRADEPHSGGWLRTGDLGFLARSGLMVSGRRKDLIIIRGLNFDPLDLEAAGRASHEALAAAGAAAFCIDDGGAEKLVLAFEVDRSRLRIIKFDEVVGNVAEAIARGFGLGVHDLVLVRSGALPRTSSGKIQRRLCRERYDADELPRLAASPHPALGRWRPGPL